MLHYLVPPLVDAYPITVTYRKIIRLINYIDYAFSPMHYYSALYAAIYSGYSAIPKTNSTSKEF